MTARGKECILTEKKQNVRSKMNGKQYPPYEQRTSRTRRLIGEDGLERLKNARVAVFGIGGVGGYAIETLARAGIGELRIVDCDWVDAANFNRQIIATVDTLGQEKAEAMKARIAAYHPECRVEALHCRYDEETADLFSFEGLDYIVDAIDTVSSKLLLVEKAMAVGVPIISCMGTGNKMHPEELCIADIKNTSVCPLARVMRRELKKRGIERLTVVYSREVPRSAESDARGETGRCSPSSMPFVPAAAGCLLGSAVVRALLGEKLPVS